MRFSPLIAAICLCQISSLNGKSWSLWQRPASWYTWDQWKQYWTYDRLVDFLGEPTEWFFVFAFDAALAAFLFFHFLPFYKNRIPTPPPSDSRRSIRRASSLSRSIPRSSSRIRQYSSTRGISPKAAGHLLDVIVTSDRQGCFLKYVCHLSGQRSDQLTASQRSFVSFLKLLPDFVPIETDSPRLRLIQATYPNRTQCAWTQTSCPHNVSSLLF